MPKQTFLNLPEEKQRLLLDVARQAFSKASFDKVSIASIVSAAHIPRGSFYQYFEDKADLYDYLIADLRHTSLEDWQKELKKQNGDLFTAFRNYFGQLLVAIVSGPNADFYRNVFLHMDYTRSHHISEQLDQKKTPKKIKSNPKLLAEVDFTKLRVSTATECHMLLHLLLGTFYQSVAYFYAIQQRDVPAPLNKTQQRFYKIVDWLQYGIQKKEGYATKCGN